MVSSNGKYRLYLREAGYLDLTCGNATIWVAYTVGYNVDSLYFGKDGLGLFLYGKDGSNWMLYGKTEMSVWKPRSQNAGQVKCWYYMTMETWFFMTDVAKPSGKVILLESASKVWINWYISKILYISQKLIYLFYF